MAEGFARTHGADVLMVQSAGLAPALAVAPLTHHVMLEKNIDLGDCYPKELEHVDGDIDLIINMSGHALPAHGGAQVAVQPLGAVPGFSRRQSKLPVHAVEQSDL